MTKFFFTYYDNSVEVYDADISGVIEVVVATVSEADVDDFEDQNENPTLDDWLNLAGGYFIDGDEAFDKVMNGAEYHGLELKGRIAIANADPEYLETKKDFTALMVAECWVCYRDKNNSVYFEKDEIKVRLSDHALGEEKFSGRKQTGGVHIDLVWNCESAEELLENLTDQVAEY